MYIKLALRPHAQDEVNQFVLPVLTPPPLRTYSIIKLPAQQFPIYVLSTQN
jgi:hypothetical protein